MIQNDNIEIEELGTGSKEKSLEDMFEAIEDVIVKLEDPDVPIEDAFAEYENGMKILKECNDKLDRIEKKVLVLSENGELNEF